MTHVCTGLQKICDVSGKLLIILRTSLSVRFTLVSTRLKKREKLMPVPQARTFIETLSVKPVFWNDL